MCFSSSDAKNSDILNDPDMEHVVTECPLLVCSECKVCVHTSKYSFREILEVKIDVSDIRKN